MKQIHSYSACIVIAHPLPSLFPDITLAGNAVAFKASRPKTSCAYFERHPASHDAATRHSGADPHPRTTPREPQRGRATTPKTARSNETEKGTGAKSLRILTANRSKFLLLEARTHWLKLYISEKLNGSRRPTKPLCSPVPAGKLLNLAQLWYPADSSRLNLESAACQAHPAAQRLQHPRSSRRGLYCCCDLSRSCTSTKNDREDNS